MERHAGRAIAATHSFAPWALACLALGLALLAGCREPVAVPSELQGSWVCEDARYVERTLEVRPQEVRFLLQGRVIDVHAVEGLRRGRERRHVVTYTLQFTAAEGYPDALELTLERGAVARLRVGARRAVWTKAP